MIFPFLARKESSKSEYTRKKDEEEKIQKKRGKCMRYGAESQLCRNQWLFPTQATRTLHRKTDRHTRTKPIGMQHKKDEMK